MDVGQDRGCPLWARGCTFPHTEGLLVGVTLKGHCDGDTGDLQFLQPIVSAAMLECWVSTTGTAPGLPSRTGGHSRAWKDGTEEDQGNPLLNLFPFPFPSSPSPDLSGNNLSPLCELWAPPGFSIRVAANNFPGSQVLLPKTLPHGPCF